MVNRKRNNASKFAEKVYYFTMISALHTKYKSHIIVQGFFLAEKICVFLLLSLLPCLKHLLFQKHFGGKRLKKERLDLTDN